MSVSVVVIGKNEESVIGRCLRSILAAAEEVGGAEVVMVDSASTDRTVEIALSLGVRVLSLKPEWELSPSAGRYIGFHHTRGEFILFVDADTVVERDFLRHALPYFAQPEVAGISGYLDDLDEQGQPIPYIGRRSAEVYELTFLRGPCSLYRRSALEQVGTFNPYLIVEEEEELALRLRKHGLRLLHIPHPMGCHLRGTISHAHLFRFWKLGRLLGPGRALRYAARAGNGLQFCIDRCKQTAFFTLLALFFVLGLGLLATDHMASAIASLTMFAAGMGLVGIKRRSLTGPLSFAAFHLSIIFGLIVGALTTKVKDPREYPRDAIDLGKAARSSSPSQAEARDCLVAT